MALQETLTQRRIFWFWLPLAAMWIMMAVEQPAIAAVTARLPYPELNLAAFGVTFALALLVEGPVIMLLTAGTALPRDRQSYQRLLNFTHLMAGGLTALHLLIGLTPLYDLIVGRLIGTPDEVLELSRQGFLLMTPWTASIAYRRLWQGVLIRFNRTKVIPMTILARLCMTTLVLSLGLFWGEVQGIYVGTVGLSLGVIAAAIVSYLFARTTIQEHLSRTSTDSPELTWPDLLSFYLPLALTSLIVLANQPLFTTALARAPQPLLSLAVWPVIMSLLFLGRSIALSYQEAVVALLKDQESYAQLQRMAWIVAGILGGIFFLLALTPMSRFWFANVAGLSPELVNQAILPTVLVAPVPFLSVLISWQRGILVHVKQTRYISHSVMISLGMLVVVLATATWLLPLPGVIISAAALIISVTAEWIYLSWRGRNAARTANLYPKQSEARAESGVRVL
jgi:progressive ankylosis protein